MTTSISRCIDRSIAALQAKDFEATFIQLFPAVDKTAKKRRPKEGVGSRVKAFIRDEEALITGIATNNVFKGIMVDDVDFPTAIYKFGRTSIVHEGELDERLQINESGEIKIGKVWCLPSTYITGIIMAVILSTENDREKMAKEYQIQLFGNSYSANSLWGRRDIIEQRMCELWRNPNLFG
ncbi:hypothetical protein AWR38_12635 [Idiomarina sp. WRN-38]|uniref:hypothetical protein n=1 Tax=Idiomarina sp. OXR-189 TaxID=3100175 RepID=UPI00073360D1|nr:hypothetical protein [Idiomarina sp. OXR-189]KTG28945.1 hypothetical protein AUR68_12620 [Idiomarina sp. H105]OAF09710.1 hypothetical protein AWR38_12635 [Idiomarina sp. WRN-38]WPZ01619.1 hypothetical protein UM402_01555 [Idiomarina sp. OXR-189]